MKTLLFKLNIKKIKWIDYLCVIFNINLSYDTVEIYRKIRSKGYAVKLYK